jgi:hypothetical protein
MVVEIVTVDVLNVETILADLPVVPLVVLHAVLKILNAMIVADHVVMKDFSNAKKNPSHPLK